MRTQMKGLTILISFFVLASTSEAVNPVQIVWQRSAHDGGTASVEFSPDGTRLASGGSYIVQSGAQSFYGENKLWASRDGTLLAQTPQDYSIGGTNEITFAPNGQTVATANGSIYCYPNGGCGSLLPGAAIYAVPNLSLVTLIHTPPINSTIDYSPNGQLLATGEYAGDFRVRIRNAVTLSVIRTFAGHSAGPERSGTFSVRFSPDNSLLASGGADGNVKIWRVSDGALLRTLLIGTELSPNVFTVAFSPDGRLIAAGTDGLRDIKVWRVADGNLVRAFSFGEEVFGYGQSNLAWTANSVYLAAGRTVYPTPLTIRFWNVVTGELAQEVTDHTNRAIYSLAFAPAGQTFATAGQRFAYGASRDVVVARTPLP
jgi:WD40 repeat protein